MRSASRILSIIAGIIAIIVGTVGIVGVGLTIGLGGGDSFVVLIKPIIINILFFAMAGAFLSRKGGEISRLISYIIMVVVLIFELFIWPGSVFLFAEAALSFIFRSVDISLTFAVYYKVIMYIVFACTLVAMILHIIAMAMKQ